MITGFELKDFKCHEGLNSFSMPGFTIACGTNNSGKSSLLQGLYLITQHSNEGISRLKLNHELKLGSFSHILNKEKGNSETIELTYFLKERDLTEKGYSDISVHFIYESSSMLRCLCCREGDPVLRELNMDYYKGGYKRLSYKLLDDSKEILYKVVHHEWNGYCKLRGIMPESIIYKDKTGLHREIIPKECEELLKVLEYLTAEHIHYLRAYRVEDYKSSDLSGERGIGLSGEFTAQMVSECWNDLIDCRGHMESFSSLFDNWIKKILGTEYKLRCRTLDKNNYKFLVQDTVSGMELELTEVGFGISQILPIITLVLVSSKEDLILIENPEIHLHPRLQGNLVDFFLWAMESGRKLVVETHSEHIINKLRLRIKERPELAKSCNLYFFHKKEGVASYENIEISTDGRITYWPKDFLEESYYDLLGLIKP